MTRYNITHGSYAHPQGEWYKANEVDDKMREAWRLVNAMAGQEYWDRAEEWLKENDQFRPEGAQRV